MQSFDGLSMAEEEITIVIENNPQIQVLGNDERGVRAPVLYNMDEQEQESNEKEEILSPFHFAENLAEIDYGSYITYKYGVSGPSPDKDVFPYFKSVKKYTQLLWHENPPLEKWRLVLFDSKPDDFDDPNLYDEKHCESIYIKDITEVYLELEPSCSLRIYRGSEVIKLSPYPTLRRHASAWTDAIFSAIQIQNMEYNEDINDENHNKITENRINNDENSNNNETSKIDEGLIISNDDTNNNNNNKSENNDMIDVSASFPGGLSIFNLRERFYDYMLSYQENGNHDEVEVGEDPLVDQQAVILGGGIDDIEAGNKKRSSTRSVRSSITLNFGAIYEDPEENKINNDNKICCIIS
eukprot:gene8023-10872_t